MKIAIIGAGFTGLTTAYYLTSHKHKVTVFEKESFPGGLAASLKENDWQWPIEGFFHHLFTNDYEAIQLIKELGLGKKLFFKKTQTSIFFHKQITPFDSPLSVLSFPHLSFSDNLRAGLVTAYLRYLTPWKKFEKDNAAPWLEKYYGRKTYEVLWKPLLKSKFSDFYPQISMAWFWSRIKKRSFKLGYLEGGFQIITDKLISEIQRKKGRILFKHEIKSPKDLNQFGHFDKILVTLPFPQFVKVFGSQLPQAYQEKAQKLKMIGALDLILILDKPFLKDKTYWLNINEPGFPFVALVEHTHFISRRHYHNQHLVYVGGYYPPQHPFFGQTKEEILSSFDPFLKKINPNYRQHLKKTMFFSSKFAQPIVLPNYSQLLLPNTTPIKNVFIANIQQIYPWDRGTNYAIWEGKTLAQTLENEK